MSDTIKKSVRKAKNGSAALPGHNKPDAEKTIEAHLVQMEGYGRDKKAGSTAKEDAILLFQADCLSNLVNASSAPRYVDRYCKGGNHSKGTRKAMSSALSAMGNPNVIKAWPKVTSTLDALIKAKNEGVSRQTTNKSKFSQLYKIATTIEAMNGVEPVVNDAWIIKTLAPKQKSDAELQTIAKESIWESMVTLFPAKPTAAQTKTRDEFFKVFGIEAPKEKEAK